jgi:hypothetical protein
MAARMPLFGRSAGHDHQERNNRDNQHQDKDFSHSNHLAVVFSPMLCRHMPVIPVSCR